MTDEKDGSNGEQQARGAEPPVKRGFAAMDKARLRELAVKGGRQAHLNLTGHQFTSEEARAAGRKGGKVCAARKAAAKAASQGR